MPKTLKKPIQLIKGDKRYRQNQKWYDWMEVVAGIRSNYADNEDGDEPFYYNEAASVSLLASAAVLMGGHALAEYSSQKRQKNDLRHTSKRMGRDDLYVSLENVKPHNADHYWVFEGKQLFQPTEGLIKKKFKAAQLNAKQTDSLGSKRGAPMLFIYVGDYNEDLRKKYAHNILKFCKDTDEVTFAVSLDEGELEECRCFLLFGNPYFDRRLKG